MAQEIIKNPLAPAQSQVITKWQTPAVNDFPFESSLQLDLAPELVLMSFTGIILGDGSTLPGSGSRTSAIPMVQNETVTKDLAGIKARMKGLDSETDLEPCSYKLTLAGSRLTVLMDPGFRCKLANADWPTMKLQFRVYAIK